jgi:hypothetical protein
MIDLSYQTELCPNCDGLCETSKASLYTSWIGIKLPDPIEGVICYFCDGNGVVNYVGHIGKLELNEAFARFKKEEAIYDNRFGRKNQ